MYKCQLCKAQSKPGDGQLKRVVEKRARTYENVLRRFRKEIVVKSEGFETVREVAVCQPCAANLPE